MAQRTALVVRGGWPGHFPVETTDLFIPGLRDAGFDVTVRGDLDAYVDADLMARTDLVVQCWSMDSATEEQVAGLTRAVRAGTGLAGWHGGVLATFDDRYEYGYLVGGRFVGHPDDFVDYTVDVVADHPVVAGLERISLHTEQYYVHVDPTLEVLATTTFGPSERVPEVDGVTCPAVWTRRFGAGRVFVSTVGHEPRDLQVPEVATLTARGLEWAARGARV